MELGIVLTYFEIRKFGFIVSRKGTVFVHSNNCNSKISRDVIVAFDIEQNEKGLNAINTTSINELNDDKLKSELYNSSDENLLKWLVINGDKVYKERFYKDYFETLKNKHLTFLEDYLNQFTKENFLRFFDIKFVSHLKQNSRDWSYRWYEYIIESDFEIKYIFENSDYYLMNYPYGLLKFEDSYIETFIYYRENIDIKIKEYKLLDKEDLNITDSYLNSIKEKFTESFLSNYCRKAHMNSLKRYLFEKNDDENFLELCNRFVLEKNLEKFIDKYIVDWSMKTPSAKELEEQNDAYYL
ncbi:S1 domain-containing protein [Maribacter hydrothermalis]|uniref:Uncharacterized protein n=1 Tax=Maribacter hydrothermalis TaxID=1836467 RepID=A0A1B7Z7X9_9FLAO|nr:cold shock domain-containing protein [Maribacter hydrothermalis]APQ15941.1 hypothetical protein BTR34_00660 [Maribacter hydrothermalis]OBR38680.1 hypothetical protein A9200_03150 [Maribacter hydrothermalis]